MLHQKRYPGIAVLGGHNISALYGVDNGIIDWQGVGIQHFFHKTYEVDLLHSGVSYIQHDNNEVELGNRKIDGKHHPIHQHPKSSKTKHGFIFESQFNSQVSEGLSWKEEVFASEDHKIVFETTVYNDRNDEKSLEVGGYVILRNPGGGCVKKVHEGVLWEGMRDVLNISLEAADTINMNVESPTGFVYQTLQTLREESYTPSYIETEHFIGVTLSRMVKLPPHSSTTIQWGIAASDASDYAQRENIWSWNHEKRRAKNYWENWLNNDVYQQLQLPEYIQLSYDTNLIAMKAAVLGGFVPADITGHYFSNGSPCYYARDAMMIARSFLLSGHYKEARDIIEYLIHRPTKDDTGEFYQRYDAKGKPSEGANNNVHHQLDSQGYFLRNILTYYQRTGKWLLPLKNLKPYVEVLRKYQGMNGLIGPEGGVNEGVFGPAFITSSNMFIYGGISAAIRIAELQGEDKTAKDWGSFASTVFQGIESAWIDEEERFAYGYVTYADEPVKKYDTPQFFGPLYGYPINDKVLKNNKFLLKYASFFEGGIGYSEQEYHHGPWMFNTAACAQFQALIGDQQQYLEKLNWMIDHSNAFLLMPEAIDAQDENHAFINPLTWACAEFAASISILTTADGFQEGNLGIRNNLW